jgi:hypothetical protein
MKNKKELKKIYDSVKGDKTYYSFDLFTGDIKELLKDMKKREVFCSLKVSKSGMTRHFGFKLSHNRILNFIYNDKISNEPVKVGGCGMDMGFHLLYTFYNAVLTKKEIDTPIKVGKSFTSSWNSLASDYRVI